MVFGFNNAEPIDIEEVTKKLRENCPGLLLQVKYSWQIKY